MPGGKSSAPSPPDYIAAANATAQGNQQGQITQFGLNNPNVVSPFGSVSYYNPTLDAWLQQYNSGGGGINTQPTTGAGRPPTPFVPSIPGRSGVNYGSGSMQPPSTGSSTTNKGAGGGGPAGGLPPIPILGPGSTTQTISLSPDQQRLFNNRTQMQLSLAGLGDDFVRNAQATAGPIDPAILQRATQGSTINQQIADALYSSRAQYLDPQFEQRQNSLEASLRAQGLQPGSEAYNNAMLNFGLERQRAYSDATNQAQQLGIQGGAVASTQNTQALQNAFAGQQQPFSQLASLLQFISPTIPQAGGTQGVGGVAGPDILGATQQGYNALINANNADNAASASTLGTLGQLGTLAYLAFCWGAYAVFGVSDKYTFARLWILYGWQGPIAKRFRGWYTRHGEKFARTVITRPWLKPLVRPFFAWAARKGEQYANAI